MSTVLREAVVEDAAAVAAIYRSYVLSSAATMELQPSDEGEMRRRMADVRERGLPFMVAEEAGEIVGYGYATLFRPRPGYRFTVEDSVYLRADRAGRGLGRRLLQAVMEACRQAEYRQMIAVIGGDNPSSIAMHRALGFSLVGVLREIGWKFDQPQDVTLMQRELSSEV
jgi:phosphinothricin acetyltransferase